MKPNRYTKLTYSNLNDLPLMQLPFEQLDQLAGQAQAEKNMFDQANAAGFKYLNNPSDVELADSVKEYQQGIEDQLVDIRKNGNVDQYRNSLKGAVTNLVKLRQPNGPIHALEDRYNQYQSIQSELKEKYKKDESNINYSYALSQLSPGDINYNVDEGTYSSISSPNVQNYIDLNKKLQETAKAMLPAEEEFSYIEGDYVWTQSGKKYDIRGALDGFWAQQSTQQQLGIEAWNKTNNLTAEQKERLKIANYEAVREKVNVLDSSRAKLRALLEDGSNKSILELQSFLKESDEYKGKLDGIAGPKTVQALANYEEWMDNEAIQLMQSGNRDVQSIVTESLIESYEGYLGALRPNSFKKKITQANWRARLSAQKKVQQDLFNMLVPDPTMELLPGSISATPVNFSNKIKEAEEAKDELELSIIDRMESLRKAGVLAEGQGIEDLKEKYSTLENVKSRLSNVDDITREYAQKLDIDPSQAAKEINILNYDDAGLKQSLIEHERMENTLGRIEDTNRQISEKYLEKEGDDYIKSIFEKLKNTSKYSFTGTEISSRSGLPVKKGGTVAQVDKNSISSYEDFKNKFLSGNLPESINNYIQRKGYKTTFDNTVKKHVEENQNEYKSAVNYGLVGLDSETLKSTEEMFLEMENKGLLNMNTDDNLMPSTYRIDGKEIKAKNLVGKPSVQIANVNGEAMIVFSRQTEDGQTAKKIVNPDGLQEKYVGEKIKELATVAINNDKPQDLLSLIPMIYPDNPLKQYSYTKVEVDPEKRKTIYLNGLPIINGGSKVLKQVGDYEVVAVKSDITEDTQYYIGKNTYDDVFELVNNLEDQPGIFSNPRDAVNTLKAYKFMQDDFVLYSQQELKNRKVDVSEDARYKFMQNLITNFE